MRQHNSLLILRRNIIEQLIHIQRFSNMQFSRKCNLNQKNSLISYIGLIRGERSHKRGNIGEQRTEVNIFAIYHILHLPWSCWRDHLFPCGIPATKRCHTTIIWGRRMIVEKNKFFPNTIFLYLYCGIQLHDFPEKF